MIEQRITERRNYLPIFPLNTGKPNLNLARCKKADLHLHTQKSDGLVQPEKIVDLALEADLNAIAITDHDKVEGSEIAINYVARNHLPIEVLRGIEVSSLAGHILALNIQGGEIRRHMSLADTIKEIHRQKGIVIIAHPHENRRNCVSLNAIGNIINSDDPELYLDGIEIFNASEEMVCRIDRLEIMIRSGLPSVINFLMQNHSNPKLGALLGNSDGHTRRVGQGTSAYSHESILTAIVKRETVAMAAESSFCADLLDAALMTFAIVMGHINGTV
jgi:hypothetical protein